MTFIDDATRKVWAYAIAKKSDVFKIFQKWLALVENQSSRTLKCLWIETVESIFFMSFNISMIHVGLRGISHLLIHHNKIHIQKDELHHSRKVAMHAFKCKPFRRILG